MQTCDMRTVPSAPRGHELVEVLQQRQDLEWQLKDRLRVVQRDEQSRLGRAPRQPSLLLRHLPVQTHARENRAGRDQLK